MRTSRLAAIAVTLSALASFGQASTDRFSAGGYFRVMTRPDAQGGFGRLGYWNIAGRLMNEGPFGALELDLRLLDAPPGSSEAQANVHTRLEGGSFVAADPGNGNLVNFRVAQLYARATNVVLDRVTWQLGTLQYFYGELGLYDMRPAQLLEDTLGLSARYQHDRFDILLAIGDAGFSQRGLRYAPLLTGAIGARVRLGSHVELGAGGQVSVEPFIEGSRFSSYVTPDVRYEDFYRKEVVRRFLEANPGRENFFQRPEASKATSVSYRAVGYLGFGNLGPLVWSGFYVSYKKLHPDLSYVENVNGRDYTIYTADLTRDRTQLQLGNEMQLTLWPKRLDAVWSVLFGDDSNPMNTIAAGEDNRTYYSTVLRLQGYLTRTVHLLAETALAREISKNGNLFRSNSTSVFQSNNGVSDSRGLQFGDTNQRDTWQLKTGIVLNPTGFGIFARPSIRLLYGVQYSSTQAAYANTFVESLDQFNNFPSTDRHWHHLVGLEAEAWF